MYAAETRVEAPGRGIREPEKGRKQTMLSYARKDYRKQNRKDSLLKRSKRQDKTQLWTWAIDSTGEKQTDRTGMGESEDQKNMCMPRSIQPEKSGCACAKPGARGTSGKSSQTAEQKQCPNRNGDMQELVLRRTEPAERSKARAASQAGKAGFLVGIKCL